MINAIIDNILLITFLPLWIFLIVMCGRFLSVYVNKIILYALTLLSSFVGIVVTLLTLTKIDEAVVWSIPFIKIKKFVIPFGIHIDKLSLIIALVLFVISFLVQVFSISYMKDEKKNYRFFALLNLFNFSMAALLFSPNLFQMYVFWELVGITSYLLIGFDYTNKEKSESSKRVFLMNRIGDTALIGGIILSSYYMYSYVADKSLAGMSFENLNEISILLSVYTSSPEFYVIAALFIIAAIVKSAQFPFYTWLQDAMEAHLPVSALLHSATMVIAGVYLVIRLLPLFTLSEFVMNIILYSGLITSIICSVLASVETHPKKILAYSTSANLGLMFIALGVENVKAALLFLIAHAFIKSMLFLELPNKDNKISNAGFVLFILGGLSLAGILFAGFCTKEYLFANLHAGITVNIFIFTSFLTAFYIARLSILIYKHSEFIKNINIIEIMPITALLCLNIIFYYKLRTTIFYCISSPFYAGIAGILTALLLYKLGMLEKLNKTPRLIERFYNNCVSNIYTKMADFCNYMDNKVFANYKPIRALSATLVNVMNWIEINIMNQTVSITADALKGISKADSIMQTKNVQTYNSYALIIITCIITLVIISYKLILEYMS